MDNSKHTKLLTKLIENIPQDVLDKLIHIKEILYNYGIYIRLIEQANEKTRKRKWANTHKDKVKIANIRNNAKRKKAI